MYVRVSDRPSRCHGVPISAMSMALRTVSAFSLVRSGSALLMLDSDTLSTPNSARCAVICSDAVSALVRPRRGHSEAGHTTSGKDSDRIRRISSARDTRRVQVIECASPLASVIRHAPRFIACRTQCAISDNVTSRRLFALFRRVMSPCCASSEADNSRGLRRSTPAMMMCLQCTHSLRLVSWPHVANSMPEARSTALGSEILTQVVQRVLERKNQDRFASR